MIKKSLVTVFTVLLWALFSYRLAYPMIADIWVKKAHLCLKQNLPPSTAAALALRGVEYDAYNLEANYYHGLALGMEGIRNNTLPDDNKKKLLRRGIQSMETAARFRMDPAIYRNLAVSYELLGDMEKAVFYANLQFFYQPDAGLAVLLQKNAWFMAQTSNALFQDKKYWAAMLLVRNLAMAASFQEKNIVKGDAATVFAETLWRKVFIHSKGHGDSPSPELFREWVRASMAGGPRNAAEEVSRTLAEAGFTHLAATIRKES